ncbi:hypothetical protein [Sphingobacterium sp. E70]|nr:hypothetical protein [Sphingobacterium sp. E70]
MNTAKFEQLSADEDLMMDQVSFEVKDGQNELAAQLAHLLHKLP